MSAAPDPGEPGVPAGTPEISEAAQRARERLLAEIERVRSGVEEMLDQGESGEGGESGAPPASPFMASADSEQIRRELEQLRIETRSFVEKKIARSEKRVERSVREFEDRSDELEEQIDRIRAEREAAEWRIYNNTEQVLDGVLSAVRSIADRLAGQPR